MIQNIRRRLISTTALTFVLSIGFSGTYPGKIVHACRASQPIRIAASNDKANPCAVKKTNNICNPCAVKKTNNFSNPCSAVGVATQCVVPRLVNTNLGLNPCAVKKASSPCNPCATKNACSPCNPCAATKNCSPCNPCAVKKTRNPCNPCATKKPGSPCNPCAAGAESPPELTNAETVSAYNCVSPSLAQAYHKSGHSAVVDYQKWKRFSKTSYPADAHGTRFMNNYANDVAAADYGKWEAAGTMPEGSVIAKDSFIVTDDGKIQVGPLFFMEKGAVGSNAATRDWQYTKITPTGIVQRDAALQKFCNDCHNRAGAEDDNLMFLPLPFRISTTSGN